jgi:5-methylcytosine-specific restriction endonuclease McrA
MSRSVLVLNITFEPLSLVSVRRAVVLLLREKAELVEATERHLCSSKHTLPEPLVIRLTRYVRLPHRSVPPTRAAVMLRDSYTCQYCNDNPGRHELTVDHVLPRSRGGGHGWENLTTACKACNHQKGNRTPEEADMILRRKPFEPSYVALVLLSNPMAASRWEALMNGLLDPTHKDEALYAYAGL